MGGLDKNQFASVINVFNDIGIFINNDALKEGILGRIESDLYQEENNRIGTSL